MQYHIFEVCSRPYIYYPQYKQAIELSSSSKSEIESGNNTIIREIESFLRKNDTVTKKEHVDAQNQVYGLYLCISNTCNARCIYCFAHQGNYGKKEIIMDPDTAHKAIDFFMNKTPEDAIASIIFFGGEPLIAYKIIKSTCEYVKQKYPNRKYSFSITTNGTILDNSMMNYMIDNNFKIAISIDGGEKVQNEQRPLVSQLNSFRLIKDNVSPFTHTYSNIIARGTYYLDKYSLVENYNDILNLGFKEVNIIPDFINMTAPKMNNLIHQLDALHEFILSYVNFKTDFPFGLFTIKIRQLFLPETGLHSDCGLGSRIFSIDAFGDIYPCHRFSDSPNTKLGTLNGSCSKSVPTPIPATKCDSCWNNKTCNHGCDYEKYKSTSNEYYCMYSKKMTELAIALCRELPKERLLKIISIPKRKVELL